MTTSWSKQMYTDKRLGDRKQATGTQLNHTCPEKKAITTCWHRVNDIKEKTTHSVDNKVINYIAKKYLVEVTSLFIRNKMRTGRVLFPWSYQEINIININCYSWRQGQNMGPGFMKPIFSPKKKKKKERTEDTIRLINSNSQSGAADRSTRISFFSVCLWRSLNNISFSFLFAYSKWP